MDYALERGVNFFITTEMYFCSGASGKLTGAQRKLSDPGLKSGNHGPGGLD